jgi:hypothetical protein
MDSRSVGARSGQQRMRLAAALHQPGSARAARLAPWGLRRGRALNVNTCYNPMHCIGVIGPLGPLACPQATTGRIQGPVEVARGSATGLGRRSQHCPTRHTTADIISTTTRTTTCKAPKRHEQSPREIHQNTPNWVYLSGLCCELRRAAVLQRGESRSTTHATWLPSTHPAKVIEAGPMEQVTGKSKT